MNLSENKCVRAWGLSAFVVIFAAMAAVALPAPAAATNDGDLAYSIARGGKLYDKWFNVIGVDAPKKTHPAWPASNTKKKGNVTHRCKSCHGWDLKGRDGAYASGSYKTGIPGVRAFAGADPAKIIAIMQDETHGFAGKMDDEDFMDLANFIGKGQVDMDQYIDRSSKKPKGGDAARGAAYFNTICVACHRRDGTYPKDMDHTLGEQMGNPWEVMHKLLNGQPAQKMPALRELNMQIILDLMAHVGTLPKEK